MVRSFICSLDDISIFHYISIIIVCKQVSFMILFIIFHDFFSMAFGCWRRTTSSDDEMHGSVGQASDQSYMRNQVESVSQ
jgi:hypothetical protein